MWLLRAGNHRVGIGAGLAGEVAPIVRDIAKTAGVSARTVFQHFSDTAGLYVAVLGRMLGAVVGDPGLGARGRPIDDRIAAITDQCSDRCERLLPMWTFVETPSAARPTPRTWWCRCTIPAAINWRSGSIAS